MKYITMKLTLAATFVALVTGEGTLTAASSSSEIIDGGNALEVVPYKGYVRARKTRGKVVALAEDSRELVRVVDSSLLLFGSSSQVQTAKISQRRAN